MATRRAVGSWILYDLANTLFSFAVVSLYFPLYLLDEFGLPDAVFAIGNSVSVAIMLLLSPAIGRRSDQARRRMPFLVGSTVACVAATAPLGLVGWPVAITLFAVANLGFMMGLVIYDALIPAVTTPANRGRITAMGVGLGYLGSVVGLVLGDFVVGPEGSRAVLFALVALAMLVLALPCMLWVRETPKLDAGRMRLGAATRDAFAGLWGLVRGREHRKLGQLFLARLFYSDAVNTMIIFMGIYVTTELGMAPEQVSLVLIGGIAGAALAAPLWGLLVDRMGATRTLRIVLVCWMFGLAAAAALPTFGWPAQWFYGIGAFLGASLAGTWSADRPLVVSLSPPADVGAMFGYYGMIGRFSAITGPLLWALIVDGLGWGRPAAVLTLLVAVAIGLRILRGLDDWPIALSADA